MFGKRYVMVTALSVDGSGHAPLLFPFAVAAFPFMSTYADLHDFSPTWLERGWYILLFSVFASCWLIVRRCARDTVRAAYAFSIIVAGLHMSEFVRHHLSLHLPWSPPTIMVLSLAVQGATIVLLVRGVYRVELPNRRIIVMLNVATVIVISSVAMNIFSQVRYDKSLLRRPPVADLGSTNQLPSSAMPDIFHIVVDGYACAEILLTDFGYDNRPFIERLQRRGFQVVPRARSNYTQTLTSLSSTLNSSYVDDLYPQTLIRTRQPVTDLFRDSWAMRSLQLLGYQIVSVSSSSGSFNFQSPPARILSRSRSLTFLTMAWWNLLPFHSLFEVVALTGLPRPFSPYEHHRRSIVASFDDLKSTGRSRQDTKAPPRFVFAHIVAPHPPFVFSPSYEDSLQGRPISFSDDWTAGGAEGSAGYRHHYRIQIDEMNPFILETLDHLMDSPRPTVIVLHADHGPAAEHDWQRVPNDAVLRQRASILSAIRVTDDLPLDQDDLKTPINTYQVLFNRYFGYEGELRPHRSYHVDWNHPLDGILIEDDH